MPRLRQAHKCSQQCSKPAYARPNDIETGGGEVAVQDDEAAKQIHSQFMQMALQLVDGRLDSSQYEDSCRQLLGMHRLTYLSEAGTSSILESSNSFSSSNTAYLLVYAAMCCPLIPCHKHCHVELLQYHFYMIACSSPCTVAQHCCKRASRHGRRSKGVAYMQVPTAMCCSPWTS